jgi:hypothetical protein
MPIFDLRQSDRTLDPLASFKVLTVMCHPNDRVQRERMLGTIQQETRKGQPRRRPLTSDEFMDEVRRADTKAGVAGALLLTMGQLQLSDYNPSLNNAIPLVVAQLPTWKQPEGPHWSRDCHIGHHPHGRENILRAFKEFRSVAHLWAALLHGQQYDRQDIWPGSLDTLPTFLAYAEAILNLACRLPSFARGRRFLMSHSGAWRFTIPDSLRITLEPLPLTDAQLAILSEQVLASGDALTA